jgi:hypothetical protein
MCAKRRRAHLHHITRRRHTENPSANPAAAVKERLDFGKRLISAAVFSAKKNARFWRENTAAV